MRDWDTLLQYGGCRSLISLVSLCQGGFWWDDVFSEVFGWNWVGWMWSVILLDCSLPEHLVRAQFCCFPLPFFFFFGLQPLVCLSCQLQLLSLGYKKQEENKTKSSLSCFLSPKFPANLLPSFCLSELSYVCFTYNAHGLELYLGGQRKVCYSIFQTLGT